MIRGLIAIVLAFVLIKYRERVVAQTGKFTWAEKYLGQGGTYNLMIIIGVFLFFWGVASITGTTDILLLPLTFFLPNRGGGSGGGDFSF